MEKTRLKYIGVKDLGNLVTANFCQRCFWFERHFGPFPSIFPGIFNVLDSVSKKSLFRSFRQRKKLPDWLKIPDVVALARLEEIGTVETFLNRSYLVVKHNKSGWILRGAPDAVFKLKDGSLHIIDFKTAKFTSKQDELFPVYEIQLNSYCLLAHKLPISRLSLVYCEPNSELKDDTEFFLGFVTKIVSIDLKYNIISGLLNRARQIVELKSPPESRQDCRATCFYLNKINSALAE
jgi:hypothetical protein